MEYCLFDARQSRASEQINGMLHTFLFYYIPLMEHDGAIMYTYMTTNVKETRSDSLSMYSRPEIETVLLLSENPILDGSGKDWNDQNPED